MTPRQRTRICSAPGCPRIVTTTRCADHERQHDQARGTKAERGYGLEHARLRRKWAPTVARGTATCSRCGNLIARSGYLGPSHTRCNLSAAGRAAHRDAAHPLGDGGDATPRQGPPGRALEQMSGPDVSELGLSRG